MSKPVLCIDASWWWGGNRDRGIGRYITFFMQQYYPPENWKRVWIIPETATPQERSIFSQSFRGECIGFPSNQSENTQRNRWMQIVETVQPQKVLVPSPFERPFSLLQRVQELQQSDRYALIQTECIVYDLIPLAYSQQVLETWEESAQQQYQQQCEAVQKIDHIYALSPHTQQSLVNYLQYPADKIQIADFVWNEDWLQVPSKLPVVQKIGIPVVTIGGGEWRKNMGGTLEWFAKAYSDQHHLYIIGKLGVRDRILMLRHAFQLGIATRIHFLGYVSEAEKWAWLFASEGFLFLSLAEGLGIPVLEAQRAGIPRVIVSRHMHDLQLDEHWPPFYEVAVDSVATSRT